MERVEAMKVTGTLGLNHARREARLDEVARSSLLTTDTKPGHLSDRGCEEAYKYFSNLPGFGHGTRIEVDGTSTYVFGFGYALQIKL
ncbi:hypothetical protein ABE85_24275 [Mitsuaria sp. 7]|nr:hypothetical protein ABE85_24275 [Mitsuaria sp. 7]